MKNIVPEPLQPKLHFVTLWKNEKQSSSNLGTIITPQPTALIHKKILPQPKLAKGGFGFVN
jgi:hypothetical protein